MIGQAAKHPEKARVLVRLRLFKPVSPKERTASMAASMSREAKLLPTVLPIEATPTGADMVMTTACNAMWCCCSIHSCAAACQCCRSTFVVCHCLQMFCSDDHGNCHQFQIKQCKPDRCPTHGLCHLRPTLSLTAYSVITS